MDNENQLLSAALNFEKNKDFKNALVYYEKVLNINKRNFDALIHIALLFIMVKKFNNALQYIEKAKRVKPSDYKISYAYFKLYEGQFKFKEALRYAKELVILKPNMIDGYYNCARTCYHLYDYIKSIEYCDKLLSLDASDIDTLCLKIECQIRAGLAANANPLYEKLLEQYPASYTIKRLYSQYLLKNRDYNNAMKYYLDVMSHTSLNKYRGKVEAKFLEYEKKLWHRENIENKTLFIYNGAFGLGDYLMFSRYIPLLEKKAKKIIIETNDSFYDLFKCNFKNCELVKEQKNQICNLEYDYTTSFMEIFYSMNEGFDNITGKDGWLEIPEEKILEMKNTGIFDTKKKKAGIFYRGSGGEMKFRDVDLEKLVSTLKNDNVQFYSIDIEKKDEKTLELFNKYDITDCSKYIQNAVDTGAILKNLDLFITIDSFPVHLAGSLGIKTFVILPVLAEWRWFDDNKTSSWYNSVRIFRQTETQNIDDVLIKIKHDII